MWTIIKENSRPVWYKVVHLSDAVKMWKPGGPKFRKISKICPFIRMRPFVQKTKLTKQTWYLFISLNRLLNRGLITGPIFDRGQDFTARLKTVYSRLISFTSSSSSIKSSFSRRKFSISVSRSSSSCKWRSSVITKTSLFKNDDSSNWAQSKNDESLCDGCEPIKIKDFPTASFPTEITHFDILPIFG